MKSGKNTQVFPGFLKIVVTSGGSRTSQRKTISVNYISSNTIINKQYKPDDAHITFL